jgi:hypothetical protein
LDEEILKDDNDDFDPRSSCHDLEFSVLRAPPHLELGLHPHGFKESIFLALLASTLILRYLTSDQPAV